MNNLSSKGLNIMLFVERIIFALAFIYLAMGEALHLNAFIQNGIDIGLPYAHFLCPLMVILTLIFCLFILTGIVWKIACFGLMFITLFSGFFFFAGAFNKVNIVGVLLSFVILINFLMLGSGQISLEYFLIQRRKKKNTRLSDIR
ncbi:MAG: hypothetical protein II183_01985 [Elusimicrobiaceae bacterium]|nr:hypothetical protein [Elusimicrobiaceae bacterium]